MSPTTTQSRDTPRQANEKIDIKNLCELIENMQEIFSWQSRLLNELSRKTRKLSATAKKRRSR
jgi:hypothetical protein